LNVHLVVRSGLNWLRELITFGLASSKTRQQTVLIIQLVVKGRLAPQCRNISYLWVKSAEADRCCGVSQGYSGAITLLCRQCRRDYSVDDFKWVNNN
jgi:hypothetical protein